MFWYFTSDLMVGTYLTQSKTTSMALMQQRLGFRVGLRASTAGSPVEVESICQASLLCLPWLFLQQWCMISTLTNLLTFWMICYSSLGLEHGSTWLQWEHHALWWVSSGSFATLERHRDLINVEVCGLLEILDHRVPVSHSFEELAGYLVIDTHWWNGSPELHRDVTSYGDRGLRFFYAGTLRFEGCLFLLRHQWVDPAQRCIDGIDLRL